MHGPTIALYTVTTKQPAGRTTALGVYVSDLRRYPVKGLAGESVGLVDAGPRGLAWDRVVALPNGRIPVQPHGWTPFEAFAVLKNRGDIGRLSARVEPREADLDNAESIEILRDGMTVASVAIHGGRPRLTPKDTVGAWLGTEHEQRRVVSPGPGLWDNEDAQVSIVNLATVRAIGSAMGIDLDPLRFRGNIYLDGLAPWEELSWLGRRLSIGGSVMEAFGSIERCRATSARPGFDGWDLNVPGGVAAHYGHIHVGIYARLITSGQIRVRDSAAPIDGFDKRRLLLEAAEEDSRAPRFADVVDTVRTAPDTYSVTLRDVYGLLTTAHAGQHLRIHRLETAEWRNYTISATTSTGTRITVRRRDTGRFSPWITNVRAGDRVAISGPYGTAHLDDAAAAPVIVLTAGIGVTPALSIAQSLADSGSDRTLRIVHVDRTADAIPHLEELSSDVDRLSDAELHVFLTREPQKNTKWRGGRPDSDFIGGLIEAPQGTTVFICGPKPFLTEMTQICRHRGVAPGSIHIDPFYSPPRPDLEPRTPPVAGPFRVQWPDRTISSWTPGEGTLLDLAESAGKQPPAGCRSGACGACESSVSGETYSLIDTFVEPMPGRTLICSSVPVGDLEVTSFS